MTVPLPSPLGMTAVNWFARFRESYPKSVPILARDEDWVECAERTISASQLLRYNLPQPGGFINFEDWALAVIQSAPRL